MFSIPLPLIEPSGIEIGEADCIAPDGVTFNRTKWN